MGTQNEVREMNNSLKEQVIKSSSELFSTSSCKLHSFMEKGPRKAACITLFSSLPLLSWIKTFWPRSSWSRNWCLLNFYPAASPQSTHWQALTPLLLRNLWAVSSFQLRKQKWKSIGAHCTLVNYRQNNLVCLQLKFSIEILKAFLRFQNSHSRHL